MKATRLFILAIILACAVYDLAAIAHAGVPASISAAMLAVGYSHPVVPFTFGALMGHFFWPRAHPWGGKLYDIGEGVAAAVAVIACLVDLLHLAGSPSPVAPALALLAGIVAGHIGFAQEAA
jgi:hypothetical protein